MKTKALVAAALTSLLAATSVNAEQTLSEQLIERENKKSKSTPEVKAKYAEGIASVKGQGIVAGAKQVGDHRPRLHPQKCHR